MLDLQVYMPIMQSGKNKEVKTCNFRHRKIMCQYLLREPGLGCMYLK